MTDGISEAYRAQKTYQEWDAPRCYVCFAKFEEKEMKAHIESHSVKQVVDMLTRWSIDSWKGDNKT